jgi:predicted MFS family arabinose efflux permease
VTLVYAITQANDYGWGSIETIGLFAAAGALLAGFVGWESRASQPLMPFSIFRLQTLVGANVAGLILGTSLFAMFLMLTLYMQQVLHFSPLRTGVGYLAVAGTAIVWSAVAAQLVTRIGVKPVLVTGMTLMTVGLLYFTQVDVGGSYLTDLLPGFLVIAIGMGFSFVPISIAALAGVKDSEAGLASGLINTSQQIGGALGIAALSAVATSTTESSVANGTALPIALTDGFEAAFIGGAIVAAIGVVASLVLIRGRDLVQEEPVEAPPAFDLAA